MVELEAKTMSIWNTKKVVGRGSLKVLQTGLVKCIVSNQDQKTGIIYCKLKLV